MTSVPTLPEPPTVPIFGFPVAAVEMPAARDWALAAAAATDRPRLLVTLNPEIIVQATTDPALAGAIAAADLIVADGVGVVWAAHRFGRALPARIPGVDLVCALLAGGGPALTVFLLGAKPGVADAAAARIEEEFGCAVVGTHHGYFDRAVDAAEVCRQIRQASPQLLLAGLGEGQERFLHEHREMLAVPLSIGVGGTLDVLAGTARRSPVWTQRLGLEWAWRVGFDPARWHRIPRLLRFARMVLRQRRQGA